MLIEDGLRPYSLALLKLPKSELVVRISVLGHIKTGEHAQSIGTKPRSSGHCVSVDTASRYAFGARDQRLRKATYRI